MRTIMTNRTILAGILLTALAAFGVAQAGPTEPDETEIIIPEFILHVEELGVEEVEAVLPSEGELALGQISLPLPGADDLVVSDVAFDAPLPAVSARREGPSVFSTGRLGAGSANHVLGELSIYKLGTDPRFRLGFAHEGTDGFQFNPAGTGFYSFTNSIDTWLSMESENLQLESEGSFLETEKGLQNQSSYNAVSVRTTDLSADLTYTPDPLVTLVGTLDGGMATRLQTTSGGASVPRDQEYTLTPEVSATIDVRAVDLIFRTSYFLRLTSGGSLPVHQDLDFTAGFEAELPWIVIDGHAGIFWQVGGALLYPWQLALQSTIGDALELGASGGYRVERTSLEELWSTEPLLAVGDSALPADLVNNGVWYATADARWTGMAGLSLRSEVEFASESAVVDILPYDTASDEFPFVQRALMSVTPSVQAAWQPSPVWQFEAGWSGRFLDQTRVDPAGSVTGAIRYTGRDGIFRADLEAVSDFYPDPAMPLLDFTGTVSAGQGVEVVMELSDLLAPLLDPGRAVHGFQVTSDYPFIEPGFVASIFARITL